jgi:hypothetical protein
MPLSRRSFLVTGSLAAGALATVKPVALKAAPRADLQDWSVVRNTPHEVEATARALRFLT